MQKYVKNYLAYFDYKVQAEVMCEICDTPAVEIHHIRGRGKGKDVIENLIAACRSCHNKCHNEELKKWQVQEIHNCFLKPENKDTDLINSGELF
jgi:5-methylcytosine-specific restriction endonuclease McrA